MFWAFQGITLLGRVIKFHFLSERNSWRNISGHFSIYNSSVTTSYRWSWKSSFIYSVHLVSCCFISVITCPFPSFYKVLFCCIFVYRWSNYLSVYIFTFIFIKLSVMFMNCLINCFSYFLIDFNDKNFILYSCFVIFVVFNVSLPAVSKALSLYSSRSSLCHYIL